MQIREWLVARGRERVRFALRCAMRISGRNFPYRMGRLLMNEARFDVLNDPAINGERGVQATVLRHLQAGSKTVVLDVGANIGDWTCAMLEQAQDIEGLEIHAFEPCFGTYDILLSRIRALPRPTCVVPVQKACSSSAGTGILHIVGVGAGTNSLTLAENSAINEQVECISIDNYCHANSIDQVSLIKIDTEGHDFEVIKGATQMLQHQRIEVLQFEYNQRWIFNGAFLRDVFCILNPFGYSIGKVTSQGVEFYDAWDWELETFREGNYLACLSPWISRFNRIVPTWNPRLLGANRSN